MRVLHINSGNLYGGIEALLTTLARCRATCPVMQPEFALCFEGRSADELRHAGAPVHVLGPTRISRPWTVWRARRNLASLLRRNAVDVAICHGSWSHALFGPVIQRHGTRLVFFAHAAVGRDHWLNRWAGWTPPERVLANSRWTGGRMTLFPHVPQEVVYCPVADRSERDRAASRRSMRTELATAEGTTVIILASRLEALKGHALLVDALARLPQERDWECWIVGGPQRAEEERYLAELRGRVERANLGRRVRFLGQRDDVPRLLAGADIHCQPNLGPESFGIAFVEALYAGLPVVTTALGGALEVLDESCALLVPTGEVAALAAALERLIETPELRDRLGEAGPARARALCDPARILQGLAQCLAPNEVMVAEPKPRRLALADSATRCRS